MSSALTVSIHLLLLLAAPPLMPGIIAKTKAWFAGRQGPSPFQTYFDILRLLNKRPVYSATTTWVFRAGPIVGLASALVSGALVPIVGWTAPLAFQGDVVAFAALLGLGRFFTMAAALDTGSSFAGMGASREAAFSALIEPALFLVFVILCGPTGSLSLGGSLAALPWESWGTAHVEMLAASAALFVALLAENSRIPVDDPKTHLELTMVHEAMVLDHSGPDLAFILYGASVKLFVFSALLVRMLIPTPDAAWARLGLLALGCAGTAIAVGTVESVMARLRMRRVPQFLLGASAVAAVGLLVVAWAERP